MREFYIGKQWWTAENKLTIVHVEYLLVPKAGSSMIRRISRRDN
jgi:hypothetical protein